MRFVCFLLCLLAVPPCVAKGSQRQMWYAFDPEKGCESLGKIYDAMPYTEGSSTPPALLKALRTRFHDARLTPLLDTFGKARGRPVNMKDRTLEYYTRSNAYSLTANAGHINIALLDASLCRKLGGLPIEPEQWLASHPARGKDWDYTTAIPPDSWFEVGAEHASFAASNDLKDKSFVAISEGMAMYRTGNRYHPEPGKRAYLVRGIRADKAGTHKLYLKDGVLYVLHPASKGKARLRFAPLVVNLPAPPKAIVVMQQPRAKSRRA